MEAPVEGGADADRPADLCRPRRERGGVEDRVEQVPCLTVSGSEAARFAEIVVQIERWWATFFGHAERKSSIR